MTGELVSARYFADIMAQVHLKMCLDQTSCLFFLCCLCLVFILVFILFNY